MVTIEAYTKDGEIMGKASGERTVSLCLDRVYEDGDWIAVKGSMHMRVQMDQGMQAGEVFLPDAKMTWRIPYGEHRMAYAPHIFEMRRHLITAREMSIEETQRVRNIACNPSDLRGNTDFFPHCTANVETRNEACFCARNVIDGILANNSHGEWPFESWGIGAREDAQLMLDFGRDVLLTGLSLVLRADFPHDAWWTKGTVVFSDGSRRTFPLERTGAEQKIDIGMVRTRTLHLEHLIKSSDVSAFPALRQILAYGCDCGNSR